jgi:hypothetical protein
MKLRTLLQFTVSALVVCGCGDATEAESNGLSSVVGPEFAEEQVIAEFALDGQTVTFVRLVSEDSADLALRTLGDIGSGDQLEALYAREGALTMLELFEALSPPGERAPDALIDAHAEQARAIGRDTVEARTIEKQAHNPPPGVSPCANSLIYDSHNWTSQPQLASLGGTSYLCAVPPNQAGSGQPAAGTCTGFTSNRQRAGACKPAGGTNLSLHFGYAVSGGSWFTTSPSIVVAPGQYWYVEFAPSATPRRLAAVAISPANNAYTLKAGVASN